MTKAVFAQPITATDIERLQPDEGAASFVRLCGALIGAALADRAGSFTLPEISERINVPDRGVDASYTTPETLDVIETGGLVGPGTTVYQFKYRDSTAASRKVLLSGIVQQLRKDLRRALPKADRYVLMTNLHLSIDHGRRLRQVLLGHPSLASNVIVVWGAAEIAQAINAAPRLRHVFFSQSGLCSLDTVESELRAAYEKVGWPAFAGHDEERRAIHGFADDTGARYLEVVGARYAGRTRLVIEAVKQRGASVIWASEPEAATLDVFRELDSHESAGILVIDNCTPAALRVIRDCARSRQRLKTIAISTGGERDTWWAEPGRIVIDRLSYGDATKLVQDVLPHVAPLQESWIIEASGALPGLILHIAALMRDGAVSPASAPDTLQRRLGDLLLEQYLAGLSHDARAALNVASALSAVGVEDDVSGELRVVSDALGIAPGTFEHGQGELLERGLLRRRGRFIEVVPPRLAEEVASRCLRTRQSAVPELMLRLRPAARRRFLERLRSLPGDMAKNIAASIFGPDGWFPDLSALERGNAEFRELATAAQSQALQCLERLLGPLSAGELLAQVTGYLRRMVVSVLDDLALGSRTFTGAAKLLLALAEAENERCSNNARGAFASLFHWSHPEVSAPLPVRLAVLEENAGSGSAARRAVVAKASGMAFREPAGFFMHHATGPAVPEEPGRPKTFPEVRSYGEGILAVLDRLVSDPDTVVEDEAVGSLLEAAAPFIKLSSVPEGFHALGSKTLDIIERVGRRSRSARRRERVVSQLEIIAKTLHESTEATPDATAAAVLDRVNALIKSLTTETLRDRLWRWVGPRSWGQGIDGENSEQVAVEVKAVAARLVMEPADFELGLLPWLSSEEAEHRSSLFHELGRQDRGERLLDPLLNTPGNQFWAQAVAAYFQGWHQSESIGAERKLDALIQERPQLSAGILAATIYLPASAETSHRVRQLVEHGRISRPELARQIALGLSWEKLSTADAERLIVSVDDAMAETRAALLHAFWLRLVRGADLDTGMESLAWSFLETTLPISEELARGRGWDMLAAKLGERDSKRLLGLVEGLMRKSIEVGRAGFDVSEELPLTWKTLLRKERPGVLEMLLGLSLTADPPHWLDWSLSKLIDPDEDMAALVAFAERAGIDGALVVANVMDAKKSGFWRLAREVLVRWGDDERLAARLGSRTLSGGWSDSAVPLIDARLRAATELLSDSDAKVARWAQEVRDDLEKWKASASREDREEWIWDGSISRAEFQGMLELKDNPERLWAIGRLLKDAPEDRVRELLSPEDILEALPKLSHLDERTRRKWEAWARHWSRAD